MPPAPIPGRRPRRRDVRSPPLRRPRHRCSAPSAPPLRPRRRRRRFLLLFLLRAILKAPAAPQLRKGGSLCPSPDLMANSNLPRLITKVGVRSDLPGADLSPPPIRFVALSLVLDDHFLPAVRLDLCKSLTHCGSQIVADRTQEVHSILCLRGMHRSGRCFSSSLACMWLAADPYSTYRL